MQKTIQVFARNVYGNTLVYPNNEQAERLALLMNVKTFSVMQLQIMLDMGFTVEHVLDPKVAAKLMGVAA